MRIVYWTITALVALVLVIFAVSNRADIELTLWPLPALLQAPTYIVVLVSLAIGFVIGELVAWIQNAKRRAEIRALRRRIDRVERDLVAAPGDTK